MCINFEGRHSTQPLPPPPKTITHSPKRLKIKTLMSEVWQDLFYRCYQRENNSKTFCEKKWKAISKESQDIPVEKFMEECTRACGNYQRLYEWSTRFDV